MLQEQKVLRNRQISCKGYYLEFKRDFDFIPGQVLGITLEQGPMPRLYSIASGKDADTVGILYSVKDDGQLTPPLSRLAPGDSLLHTPPSGTFYHQAGLSWWIASGTGISPFLSWLRSGMDLPERLIFGARHSDGLFFRKEIATAAGAALYPCISADEKTDAFHGRVTDFLGSVPLVPLDCHYFLCGVAEMIVDTRDLLIARGVGPGKIHAEIYF